MLALILWAGFHRSPRLRESLEESVVKVRSEAAVEGRESLSKHRGDWRGRERGRVLLSEQGEPCYWFPVKISTKPPIICQCFCICGFEGGAEVTEGRGFL